MAILNECIEKMDKTLSSLKDSFGTLRAGRVSPGLLDKVIVNVYDSNMPLKHVASITVASATDLVVKPFDPSTAKDILSGLNKADLGCNPVVNGGAIRAPLPVGPIDRGTLLEMHPFGNRLALISLTGREIRAALEHGLAEPGVVGPHLLQPAGLRYAVRPEAPVGRRVLRVEVRGMRSGRVVWTPIEPEARYRVATLEYLARGGDGFPSFARAPRLPCPPCSKARDVEVFEAHIRAHDPVPMPERGRIEGMPPANF